MVYYVVQFLFFPFPTVAKNFREEEMLKQDEEAKKEWENAVAEEKKVKCVPLDPVKKARTFGSVHKPMVGKGTPSPAKPLIPDFNPKAGLVSKPTATGKRPNITVFSKKEKDETGKGIGRGSKPI